MATNFNQDPEDNRSYQKTVAMCVAAASLVILLFLVILYVNTDKAPSKKNDTVKTEEEKKEKDDIMADSHNITSDELEFWDDAKPEDVRPQKEDEGKLTQYNDPSKKKDKDKDRDATDEVTDPDDEDADKDKSADDTVKDKNKDKDRDAYTDEDGYTYVVDGDEEDTSKKSSTTDRSKQRRDDNDEDQGGLNKDNDEEDDDTGTMKGDYITVKDDKGNKKRYEILSSVPKNDYDLKNDLTRENNDLKYKDTKREAVKGVDLSKYNGTVDFNALKQGGVGFAMLRLGSRGYGTGAISLDEKFVEYAQNAQLSGIQIGAYFYSQAVSETEAIEEANYIVGAVSGFDIKYPIAIDVEKVSGDEARTDNLTSEERTKVVKAFCDTVKGYGYKPIIYATRDMLIAGMDLEDLTDYDVWLSDDNVPTDYPYRFSMWQYDRRGSIEGINGDIDLNLSFINYEQK